MVFNDSNPSFSISSILSRYDSSATATTPSTISKPLPTKKLVNNARPNGTGSGPITSTTTSPPRSSLSSTSKSAASQMSRDTTTKVVTSSKPDINSIKRRKTEEVPKSSLELLKERKELLQRKSGGVTTSTSTAVSNSTSKVAPPRLSTGAATARPGSGIRTAGTAKPVAEAPKPMSYRERMAAALQAGAEKKPAAGTITHKARPLVKEKKAWQLKLEGQGEGKGADTMAGRNSKSPGVSGGEKAASTSKKTADIAKPVTKKSSNGANGSANGVGSANGANGRKSSIGNGVMSSLKGKDKDRGKHLEAGMKRKRESPPPKSGYSSYSRNKYSTNHKRYGYGPPRPDSYEEDDPDDDFVVNDEDDEDDAYGRGGGYGGFAKKKYSYIDYDSASDMEATGADVLEEEERSRRVAAKEDAAQEKFERELAAKKAALKKKGVLTKKK
ncbi:unnamed protein product [Tuber melanosporum]|uniref:(Perigord truffle) hypothetical protein n=1 Tax=Tuber melanosporum (strain Mel28) TaxID=656061 RepID=D5G5W2_TUBMM|nr:uncharacterized protein GSTUM_00001599001 [Tuber melanosporum]CAZ79905.1 unnamed protein product [Tuber melanosporum]